MKRHEHARLLLQKAAQDEAVLDAILAVRAIGDDVFGFHAQQAVEKLLKAWLAHLGADYPKVHNLRVIVDLLQAAGAEIPEDLKEVESLTPYATIYRYEDLPIPRSLDRQQVRQQIRRLRAYVEARIEAHSEGNQN